MERLGVATIIATDIATDGMMTGPNLESLGALASATGVQVIASGGVRNIADLCAIRDLGHDRIIGAITGKAVYEGALNIGEALTEMARASN